MKTDKTALTMAEREGFEPSVELPPHILSRDAQSATLSPLHAFLCTNVSGLNDGEKTLGSGRARLNGQKSIFGEKHALHSSVF